MDSSLRCALYWCFDSGQVEKGNGAGNGTRTRDLHLGKVSLYQLSYSRILRNIITCAQILCKLGGKLSQRSAMPCSPQILCAVPVEHPKKFLAVWFVCTVCSLRFSCGEPEVLSHCSGFTASMGVLVPHRIEAISVDSVISWLQRRRVMP